MSIIQFLIDSGYSIPRFCYHGLLSIAGNCRICVVDDKEVKTSVSCSMCYESYRTEILNYSAIVGLHVKSALSIRENIFEFLLLSHPLDCPICDRGGECELQDMTNSFGSDRGRNFDVKSCVKDKVLNMAISTHMTRCITCGRCVRFLREVINNYNIGIVGRGNMCEISSYVPIISSIANIFISNIIDLCPVNNNYYYVSNTIDYSNIYCWLSVICIFSIYSVCIFYLCAVINVWYSDVFRIRLYYSLPINYLSRNLLNDVYECVLCASCTASCPSYWWNGSVYLGPAVLLQSYRWIVDSKDSDVIARLELYDLGYNLSLCHAIGNCEIVCPKNLNPAELISNIKSVMSFKLDSLYYID